MGIEEVDKGGPFTPGDVGLSHGAERHCTVLQIHQFFSQGYVSQGFRTQGL